MKRLCLLWFFVASSVAGVRTLCPLMHAVIFIHKDAL